MLCNNRLFSYTRKVVLAQETTKKTKLTVSKGLLLFGGLVTAGVFLAVSMIAANTGHWVKTDRGLWVKVGTPNSTPAFVVEQQVLLVAAQALYDEANSSNQNLAYGPCLGSIGDDWVVDIAHDPRIEVDDIATNQCTELQNGTAHHYIELDPDGNLIRVH